MSTHDSIDLFIKKLGEVLESSMEGAVISDMRKQDNPLIYCNNTFLTMTGYKREEVIGRNCRFLQQDDVQQEGLFVLRSAIKAQLPCKVILRNYRKNGELFFNRLSISPITNDKGELTHYLGIQDDVTDIISVDRELKQSEKERKVLLSEVHHRVKNNLSVMSSLMELEQTKMNQKEALEKSRIRVHSMAMIHERLYQKEGFAYIDFSDFIRDLATSDLIYKDKCDVKLDFDFDLQKIGLNINQAIPFAIIVSELFDNIYRHAYNNKENGKVDVMLSISDEKEVLCRIIDYGRGLPENVNFHKPDTVGFTVINTLLTQIDAEAKLLQNGRVGFGVQVQFPKSDRSGSSQRYRINE